MRRQIISALCCLFCVAVANVAAQAATIVSNNFSLGFGSTGSWTTTETNAANTPITVGNANATPIAIDADFTLTPTVAGGSFTSAGPTFTGRMLGDSGGSFVGWSNNFAVTLAGVYSGTLPFNAVNVRTTVNITGMSIFAGAFDNGASFISNPNVFRFNETTIGNTANSPYAATLLQSGSLAPFNTAANFVQLTWNPGEMSMLGLSATRTFTTTGFGNASSGYLLDGYEIFGNIEVAYGLVPEPTSLALLSLGLLGAIAHRRRRVR